MMGWDAKTTSGVCTVVCASQYFGLFLMIQDLVTIFPFLVILDVTITFPWMFCFCVLFSYWKSESILKVKGLPIVSLIMIILSCVVWF